MMIPVLVLAKHAACGHLFALFGFTCSLRSSLFFPINNPSLSSGVSRVLFVSSALASVIAMRNRWVAGAKCFLLVPFLPLQWGKERGKGSKRPGAPG